MKSPTPDGRNRATPLSTVAAPAAPTSDELSALISHVQSVREQERMSLSRTLHDDMGGLLVGAVMDLGWIEQHQCTDDLRLRLERVRRSLSAAIDLKRHLTEELRPSLLDNFGLFAACGWYVAQRCRPLGVRYTGRYPCDELPLRPDASVNLFRVLQEILAVILVEDSVTTLTVEVSLDGEAFVLSTAHTHAIAETVDVFAGLPSQMGVLAQRAAACDGRLNVERGEMGTVFDMRFPLSSLLSS